MVTRAARPSGMIHGRTSTNVKRAGDGLTNNVFNLLHYMYHVEGFRFPAWFFVQSLSDDCPIRQCHRKSNAIFRSFPGLPGMWNHSSIYHFEISKKSGWESETFISPNKTYKYSKLCRAFKEHTKLLRICNANMHHSIQLVSTGIESTYCHQFQFAVRIVKCTEITTPQSMICS